MIGEAAESIVVDALSYPVVRPTRVFLVHAHFEDTFVAETLPVRSAFLVDLVLSRSSELELSVALTVSTTEDSPYQLSITYAADFAMSDEVLEGSREDMWRYAAYELAPSLLYPYIREAFSSVTSRSRLGAEALPFLPLPLETPEEDQEIPPPPSDSDYQPALALGFANVPDADVADASPRGRKKKTGQGKGKRGGR